MSKRRQMDEEEAGPKGPTAPPPPSAPPSPLLQPSRPAAAAAGAAAAPPHILGALSPRPNAPAFAFAQDPPAGRGGQAHPASSGPPTPNLILAPEGGGLGSGPASPFGFGAAATPPPASRTPGGTHPSLAPVAFALGSGSAGAEEKQAKALDVAVRNPFQKAAPAAVAAGAGSYVSPMFGGGMTSAALGAGVPTPAALPTSIWGAPPPSTDRFSFTAQTASATAEAAAATTPNLGWAPSATAAAQPAVAKQDSHPTLSASQDNNNINNNFLFSSEGSEPTKPRSNDTNTTSGTAVTAPSTLFAFGAPAQPSVLPSKSFASSQAATVPEKASTGAPSIAPVSSAATATATTGFSFGSAAPAAANGGTAAGPAFGTHPVAGFGAPAAAKAAAAAAPVAFGFGGAGGFTAGAAASAFGTPAANAFSFGGCHCSTSWLCGGAAGTSNGDEAAEPEAQDEFNKEPMQLKADQGSEQLFRFKSKAFIYDKKTSAWTDKGVGNISLYAGRSGGRPLLTFTTDSGKVLFCVNVSKAMKIVPDNTKSTVAFSQMWSPDPAKDPTSHNFMLKLPKEKPLEFQQHIQQLQAAMSD
ncbi:MAG: hypothetical protein WDW38_004093 [Sanguina aurantia]